MLFSNFSSSGFFTLNFMFPYLEKVAPIEQGVVGHAQCRHARTDASRDSLTIVHLLSLRARRRRVTSGRWRWRRARRGRRSTGCRCRFRQENRRTGADSSGAVGGGGGGGRPAGGGSARGAAVGGGGAARGGGGGGVAAAGLRARVRAVLPVSARHGKLPVRAGGLRVVPRRLPLHVPRQVLPRPLPLAV